jgi:dephospho-CoA kinase
MSAAADAGQRPLRIGLTGPIGCGKSSVARWLAQAGGMVVDADELARASTALGEPALDRIRERFGEDVFAADGSLDRAGLARIVFEDPEALRDLERIVHPDVRRRIEAAVAAAEARGVPFVVVEAIKLVEAGYAKECDEVWLVACGPATQRARLAARGFEQADLERRLGAQGSDLVERLSPAATRRLVTEGTLAETRALVEAALRAALAAASEREATV